MPRNNSCSLLPTLCMPISFASSISTGQPPLGYVDPSRVDHSSSMVPSSSVDPPSSVLPSCGVDPSTMAFPSSMVPPSSQLVVPHFNLGKEPMVVDSPSQEISRKTKHNQHYFEHQKSH